MSRVVMWSLVVCVVALWFGTTSVHGDELCVEESIDACERTGILDHKNFTVLNDTEFARICKKQDYMRDCLSRYHDDCPGFDTMELQIYALKYKFRCDNVAAFKKHRECFEDVEQTSKCPIPELITRQEYQLVDSERVNQTRNCWKSDVQEECGKQAARLFDDMLGKVHDIIEKTWSHASSEERACFRAAGGQCWPVARQESKPFLMSTQQLSDFCEEEEAIDKCLHYEGSGCQPYDLMLVDKEVEEMKYICNTTAEFLQYRECTSVLSLKPGFNCSFLQIPRLGGEITGEVTEETVNKTKACWMSAAAKMCPGSEDWYEGYADIRYELALKYSSGAMLMASLITMLMALSLSQLLV